MFLPVLFASISFQSPRRVFLVCIIPPLSPSLHPPCSTSPSTIPSIPLLPLRFCSFMFALSPFSFNLQVAWLWLHAWGKTLPGGELIQGRDDRQGWDVLVCCKRTWYFHCGLSCLLLFYTVFFYMVLVKKFCFFFCYICLFQQMCFFFNLYFLPYILFGNNLVYK